MPPRQGIPSPNIRYQQSDILSRPVTRERSPAHSIASDSLENWQISCQFMSQGCQIFVGLRSLNFNYTNLIAKELSDKINCILTFAGSHFNDRMIPITPDCVVYADCKFVNCMSFRIEFFFDNGNYSCPLIVVKSKGSESELHENFKIKTARHLNRLDRLQEMENIGNSSPTMVKLMKINEMKADKAKMKRYVLGDLGEVRSVEAFKKLQQEKASFKDYHEDDFLDLICIQKSDDIYSNSIISISSPFEILIVRKEAIELYKKQGFPTIYFDATGTVVRKSIYY